MDLVTGRRLASTLAKYRLVSEFAGSNVRIALDLERDGKEYLAVFQNENANGVTFRTGKSTLDLPHGSGGYLRHPVLRGDTRQQLAAGARGRQMEPSRVRAGRMVEGERLRQGIASPRGRA